MKENLIQKIEKIILKKPKREKLPQIPSLVKQYYQIKEYKPKGEKYNIIIKQCKRDSRTDGIAYFNELIIERKGKNIYTSGMLQYRGAYNWEIDNDDLRFLNPSILEEKEDEVIFGLETLARNIKIYKLKRNKLEELETFNIGDYLQKKERNEIIEKILEDPDEWVKYIKNELAPHWYIDPYMTDLKSEKEEKEEKNNFHNQWQLLDRGNLVIALAQHYDRPYDPVADLYRIYFWKIGTGIAKTKIYDTQFKHPPFGKYYKYSIRFLEPAFYDKKKEIIRVKIGNKSQGKEIEHLFKLVQGEKNQEK